MSIFDTNSDNPESIPVLVTKQCDECKSLTMLPPTERFCSEQCEDAHVRAMDALEDAAWWDRWDHGVEHGDYE